MEAHNSVLQARRDSDNQWGGGGVKDRAGLEVKRQRESKEEEREDSRVAEATSWTVERIVLEMVVRRW